jgi:hypothetical protein
MVFQNNNTLKLPDDQNDRADMILGTIACILAIIVLLCFGAYIFVYQ